MRTARIILAAGVQSLLAHGGTGGLLVELALGLGVLALAALLWIGGRRGHAEWDRERGGEEPAAARDQDADGRG